LSNTWHVLLLPARPSCLQLSALVLAKLLQSCPDMHHELRAGYLVGDTEPKGGSGALTMNNRVSCPDDVWCKFHATTRKYKQRGSPYKSHINMVLQFH
jgi:hypothetical protein